MNEVGEVEKEEVRAQAPASAADDRRPREEEEATRRGQRHQRGEAAIVTEKTAMAANSKSAQPTPLARRTQFCVTHERVGARSSRLVVFSNALLLAAWTHLGLHATARRYVPCCAQCSSRASGERRHTTIILDSHDLHTACVLGKQIGALQCRSQCHRIIGFFIFLPASGYHGSVQHMCRAMGPDPTLPHPSNCCRGAMLWQLRHPE